MKVTALTHHPLRRRGSPAAGWRMGASVTTADAGPGRRAATHTGSMLAALVVAAAFGGGMQQAHADDPAPPYTVEMTIEHTERVAESPYVTPTATANEQLVIGQSRGWHISDYPYDVETVGSDRLTAYAAHETIPRHDLYAYRITDPAAEGPKASVVLSTGQHNTEHTGSWAFQAAIDFLVSDDPRAAELRRAAVFYVYPLLNPDGRYTLTRRGGPEILSAGWLDHNRVWGTAGMIATIDAFTMAMRYDTRREIDYVLDFHSTGSTYFYHRPEAARHSPLVDAMAEREPEIEPRLARLFAGYFGNWAVSTEGLDAPQAFTPELAHATPKARSLEIGRSYALALYDVLAGDLADVDRELPAEDATANDRSTEPGEVAHPDPLLRAARRGEREEVAALLEDGHDITVRDERGRTALHLAAEQGHDRIAALLLRHGAPRDARNELGRRPIYLATNGGHEAVEAVLLAAERAAWQANPELVEDRNRRWGFTALHRAAGAGETAIVALLLEHGEDIDRRDHNAKTPLRFAAEGGHTATAQFLLEHGAAIDATDGAGNTPLHLAATGCRPVTEHWTTYCRGDCRATGNICERGYADLGRMLIERGASVAHPNDRGWTPLHYAGRYGDPNVAQLLIEHGAASNALNDDGDGPLHLAVALGHLEVVEVLVGAGADVTLEGRWGRTPIDWARRLGDRAMMDLLEHAD